MSKVDWKSTLPEKPGLEVRNGREGGVGDIAGICGIAGGGQDVADFEINNCQLRTFEHSCVSSLHDAVRAA